MALDEDKVEYWNQVCVGAQRYYCGGSCAGASDEVLEKFYAACRFMPTGLDVMDILGSERAEELLDDEFCGYEEQREKMIGEVADFDEWNSNIYNSWLWMLQPIIDEKPDGFPIWMQSYMWRNKDLITALSSWSELRHDTILYVKQSYTRAMMEKTSAGPLEAKYYGYVEPNPEFFARAKFINDFLIQGLGEQDLLTEEAQAALERSSALMDRLIEISQKELRNEVLTEDDYDFIENIDISFNEIIQELASTIVVKEGVKVPGSIETTTLEGKYDAFKTTIIADVHTEANSKKVLEVGTGQVDWLIVAHKSADGSVGLAVGPMFSYYEFPWDMNDRLTDTAWREMLSTNYPQRPDWISEFIY